MEEGCWVGMPVTTADTVNSAFIGGIAEGWSLGYEIGDDVGINVGANDGVTAGAVECWNLEAVSSIDDAIIGAAVEIVLASPRPLAVRANSIKMLKQKWKLLIFYDA